MYGVLTVCQALRQAFYLYYVTESSTALRDRYCYLVLLQIRKLRLRF